MAGYVYILVDDNDRHYIGSSAEPKHRYKRHLSGFVYTTSRMKNPKMVLCQKFETIQQARRVELKIKKLKRRDYVEKIVQDGYIKMKP